MYQLIYNLLSTYVGSSPFGEAIVYLSILLSTVTAVAIIDMILRLCGQRAGFLRKICYAVIVVGTALVALSEVGVTLINVTQIPLV